MVRFPIWALILASLSGCGPSYSPDTYASNAAQQANKVEQGVVVGVRSVAVSAAGTVGTVTGAAAGGIAGSQLGVGPVSAFTALGGSLAGGIGGSAVEHVTADTKAFEYIVRKPNGDLISVTQKDRTPLALGQKVLVIAGVQARVVPDYTVPPEVPAKLAGPVKPTAPVNDAPARLAEPVKADQPVPVSNATDPKPAEIGQTPVKPDVAPPAAASSITSAPVVAPPGAASVAQPVQAATP